jgi:hypothetical protein
VEGGRRWSVLVALPPRPPPPPTVAPESPHLQRTRMRCSRFCRFVEAIEARRRYQARCSDVGCVTQLCSEREEQQISCLESCVRGTAERYNTGL